MKCKNINTLYLKRLGINTYKESVIYIRSDSEICRLEGFEAQARIKIKYRNREILATLNTIESELLKHNEVGLSEYAWKILEAKEKDPVCISHAKLPQAVNAIRSKIYGHTLSRKEIYTIIKDLVAGSLSDIHVSAFLAASGDGRLNQREITYLTEAMIEVGEKITWSAPHVVDKHCVGGLPGNRTTLIVVPIVASYGLIIPKTSSRAITSPAGTADTMEVLAPVELNLSAMRKVVERENGCIVWGGAVALSPADDLLIRIERGLTLDSEGQMVASILSKKLAAGSTDVVIDMPIGPTAKIRSIDTAHLLKQYLENIGRILNLNVHVVFTDGRQPVGSGIGPSLEARDVLRVLQGDKNASEALRERALLLAGMALEFSPNVKRGEGRKMAQDILESGAAWEKFQAICDAQGGMSEPQIAPFTYTVVADKSGKVVAIDNRHVARIAKLAGAPQAKSAGIDFLVLLGADIEVNQPLFIIHAESKGALDYAKAYLMQGLDIVSIQEYE